MNLLRGLAKRRAENSELGFWALIATQFQGAFSDNVFKMLVVLFLPVLLANPNYPVTALSFLLFNIPFLIFPGFAGTLSDRLSKKTVTVMTKYLEVVVMSLGLVAFLFRSPVLILGTVFLMATQSALFSPAKYGILPEILPEHRLSWGNGILQMGTFLAIIMGTAVAGPILEVFEGEIYQTSFVLIACSLVGLTLSHFITRPPAAAPEQRIRVNPWSGMGDCFKVFKGDRWLFLTMLGMAYFWFAGVLVSQTIIEYGKATFESPTQQSLLLAAMAMGIGAGSFAAGYLSRGKIEVGLIPLGGMGLSALCLILGFGDWGYASTLALLFGLGFFAGVFDLPMAATLQKRSPKNMKGGMIAASNFVTFSAMSLAAVLFLVLFNIFHFSASAIFILTGIMTLAVSGYICWLLPIFLLRFGLWCVMNTVYRIRVIGRVHVPETGGALLVANHMSFIDALIILASTDRQIHFMMHKSYYDRPWLRPLAKMMGVIPILPKSDVKEIANSLRAASTVIEEGEVVCIFAEGQISRTGEMLPFRRGLERIMTGLQAPIVPVYLGNVWGSIFSYSEGRFFWKIPRRIPYPIDVHFGRQLSPDSSATKVRQAVSALGEESKPYIATPSLGTNPV